MKIELERSFFSIFTTMNPALKPVGLISSFHSRVRDVVTRNDYRVTINITLMNSAENNRNWIEFTVMCLQMFPFW